MPPRQLALQQADVLYQLSSVHHTRLGHYRSGWFEDDAIDRLGSELQRHLAAVEAAIQAENRRRPRSYPVLRPSLIPQSTNI